LTFSVAGGSVGVMEPTPPWEAIHPSLNESRLRVIAAIILQYRAKKQAARCPEDGPWNIGCDCYQWARHGIRMASIGKYKDWLRVLTGPNDMEFLFQIGGPSGAVAKFYREDSPGQPTRALKISELEERARAEMLLPFAEPLPPEQPIRFAVVEVNGIESVKLVRLDQEEEALVYSWPISTESVVLELDEQQREPGVELGEPPVELPEDDSESDVKKRKKEKGA
jgi:hypothetical protein